MNWFRATKNHIHHRLLELGFVHAESVVAIYTVHTFLVISGLFLRYANDWIILGLYLSVTGLLFGFLHYAEKTGWNAGSSLQRLRLRRALFQLQHHYAVVVLPRRILQICVLAFFVIGPFVADKVPRDVGILSAVVFVFLAVPYLTKSTRSMLRRVLTYLVAALVIYLTTNFMPRSPEWFRWAQMAFFALMALSIAITLRFSPGRREKEFRVTVMDYLLALVLFAALIATVLFSQYPVLQYANSAFIVYLAVLLYGCEVLIAERREHPLGLGTASFIATAVMAFRGLF
jgi:UDP-GlcNAc:undecaprenyl-phosphate GlcNAc-1-phosphate transferase